MKEPLSLAKTPELIFGLVAPVGVDLDLLSEVLVQTLREMNYKAAEFRLTKLMREIPISFPLRESAYIQSVKDRIAYANEVRRLLGDHAMAALAISAIRDFRTAARAQRPDAVAELSADERAEEAPLANQAYIIRQFKRPEEIALLRSVYGRQFILVSAYAPEEVRRRRIEEEERRSCGGLASEVEVHNAAYALVAQDAKEILEKHGQNVRDAFPLGDVFIDASTRNRCEDMVRRFVHLLFGSNEITPTHDEYGMYIAKSASLRSSDLSRQVGAAIFRPSGEIATMGCNEVPKTGGGTYWSGDDTDRRDFVEGHDPNDRQKTEILVDLIGRLLSRKLLSQELQEINDANQISKILLDDDSDQSVRESRLMDLLEFGRIIHAEMSAISDAARKGVSIQDGTLYCTVFPCHLCAKHIVASGIRRVVYLEPYAKSYAEDLHKDSIHVDPDVPTPKVSFEAFIGVSPYRYRDLFEKGKRKYSGGMAQKWNRGQQRPMVEIYYPSYFKAETAVVASIRGEVEKLLAGNLADPK
jgi:cytidine deaminase